MDGGRSSGDRGPAGDDDINKRLAEIAAELAKEARFKERSAAERARDQSRPANAAATATPGPLRRWRNARTAARLRAPVTASARERPATPGQARAWRRSSSRAEPPFPQPYSYGTPLPAPRSRRRALVITVVVIAALIATPVILSRLGYLGSAAGSNDLTSVKNGATPTGLATNLPVTQPPPFSVADPFAGTPAEKFADGIAGIVASAPRTVGRYSAAQVRGAYRATRKLLIAAYLNPQTLGGASPTAFARLLIPTQRSWFIKNLDKIGLTKQKFERSTRGWVTSFAPGTTEFVGPIIKVHGWMTSGTVRQHGNSVLRVVANYLFVYPVQQPRYASTRMRIVQHAVVTVDFAQWNDPGGPLEAWIYDVQGGAAGARCDVNDGFVHPAFPGGPAEHVKVTGTPVNPYDQTVLAHSHGGCQATTGT